MPKKFRWVYGYMVTDNKRERTCTIYNPNGEFLSTVDDGEVMNEIRKLEGESD